MNISKYDQMNTKQTTPQMGIQYRLEMSKMRLFPQH